MQERSKACHKDDFEIPGGNGKDLFCVLGLNDTSTLVGHFVSSPREKEKKERRDSR